MNFSLNLKTQPALEPVTLAEIKAHSVVDFVDDDALLDIYARTARERVEKDTGICLIDQVWLQGLECFEDEIKLLKTPNATVVSIKYLDADGAEQTLATEDYAVGERFGVTRICPAYGKSWPAIRAGLNAITIEFTAGFGEDGNAVPALLKQAIMVMAEHLYENRGVVSPVNLAPVPESYASLIASYEQVGV